MTRVLQPQRDIDREKGRERERERAREREGEREREKEGEKERETVESDKGSKGKLKRLGRNK